MPYFLYEVSTYKITRDMAYLLNSKFFKSDKLLKIKRDRECKKVKNFRIIRFIELIGAPMKFIRENNLPIYETIKKIKK